MYKIGDRVRVRANLKDDEFYNGTYFNPIMGKYKGRIFTVSEVKPHLSDCTYNCEGVEDIVDGMLLKWQWSEEMLEPVRQSSPLQKHFQKHFTADLDAVKKSSDDFFSMIAEI